MSTVGSSPQQLAAPQLAKGGARRLLIPLMALFVGTTLALLVGELAVRLLIPQVDVEMWFESNPRYGHTLKPNFHQQYHYPSAGVTVDVRTNSLGHRDREHDLARTDLRRLLLIGDSFTFGEGLDVEHSFATRLQALLDAGGLKYDVINAGVGGWGTAQETTYARDNFGRFRPDVIVLTFCGNDPDDDAEFQSGR